MKIINYYCYFVRPFAFLLALSAVLALGACSKHSTSRRHASASASPDDASDAFDHTPDFLLPEDATDASLSISGNLAWNIDVSFASTSGSTGRAIIHGTIFGPVGFDFVDENVCETIVTSPKGDGVILSTERQQKPAFGEKGLVISNLYIRFLELSAEKRVGIIVDGTVILYRANDEYEGLDLTQPLSGTTVTITDFNN